MYLYLAVIPALFWFSAKNVMPAKKFYAVRGGPTPGIYESWPEACRRGDCTHPPPRAAAAAALHMPIDARSCLTLATRALSRHALSLSPAGTEHNG